MNMHVTRKRRKKVQKS